MTIAAYKRTISETEAPRQIERRVLAQVTAEMERFYLYFDNTEDKLEKLSLLAKGLSQTVWKNQQIWSVFKHDLAENKNALDPQLKASLISLAIWVDRHTQGVLHGSKKIKPLIDVNRLIFNGLGGKVEEQTE